MYIQKHAIHSIYNFYQAVRKKILIKFFIAILIVTLLPIMLLGLYYTTEANKKVSSAITESKEKLIENSITLQIENLEYHARWIDLDFTKIQKDILNLKLFTEHFFNNMSSYNQPPGNTDILQHSDGYYYSHSDFGNEISNIFISSAATVTPQLLSEIQMSRHLEPLFSSYKNNNNQITTVYFLFSESALRIYPKLDMESLIDQGLFPADLLVEEHSFYNAALPENNPGKSVTLTEIYEDITDRGYMVTWNAPIYLYDGSLRGVVGMDITVEDILQSVLKTKFKHEGMYAFLLTHTGQIVSPQDILLKDIGINVPKEQITFQEFEDSPFKLVLSAMLNQQSGSVRLTLNNEEKYLLYRPIPVNNWSIAYVIPEKALVEPLELAASEQIEIMQKEILFRMLLATLVSILIAGNISRLMAKKIARPIMELTDGVNNLANGDFKGTINLQSEDEVGELISGFNKMSTKIRQLIKDLEFRAQKESQLSATLFELNEGLERKVIDRTISLKNALDNIKSMESARRVLLNNISHELKTPITMLTGYIEALHDGIPKDKEEFKEYLTVIYRQSGRLNRLINDLIDLSHIEARQSMNFTEINTNEFFLQYFDELSFYLEKKKLRFSYTLPPNLSPFIGDAGRIIQVLINLVQNAIRYTPKSGQISITVKDLTDKIQIEVQDDGCGIESAELSNIFQRFYRGISDTTTLNGTSGLGLAIAKEIVEAHGGTIWAHSNPGEGATFIFTLPTKR